MSEDWRDPVGPIQPTEASRAFVPPCTRADISRAAALGPDEPLGGTGTLATNSAPNEEQWSCQCKNPRSEDVATLPLPVRRAASITIGLATIRNGGEDTLPGRGPHGRYRRGKRSFRQPLWTIYMETIQRTGDALGVTEVQERGSAPSHSQTAACAAGGQQSSVMRTVTTLVRRLFSRPTLLALEAAMALRFWPPDRR